MSLTGVQDCDISILALLEPKDLISISLTTTYMANLCMSDVFWNRRYCAEDEIAILDGLCEMDNVPMFMKCMVMSERASPEWIRGLLHDYLDYSSEKRSWKIFDYMITNIQFDGDEYGCTGALSWCIDTLNFGRFKMLIEKGCQPTDWLLNDALTGPIVDPSTIHLIMSKGVLPSHGDGRWPTIVYAMRGGNLEMIKLVLENTSEAHRRLVFDYKYLESMEVDQEIFDYTKRLRG